MLSERFPRTSLESLLLRFDDYNPYPRVDVRDSWQKLPDDLKAMAIERGEEVLDFDWPALTAERYMDFAREGNRSRYEALYFRRRSVLGSLALAECVEDEGRFIDQIVNGLWAICEESSWVVPAHNSHSGKREALPVESSQNVDLFAADTASMLSWIHYLLGSRLDAVSPIVTLRIRNEVERRILTPFRTVDLHWMGFHDKPVNNWNPWCTSNCLASALLLESDDTRRLDAVERSLRILDNWLRGYAPDGGCDEGPGYWNVAGGCFFDCLELLMGATGGKVCFYDDPLVGEIGRYIMRVHISGDYFVNFADGTARLAIDACMIYRYGQRIGDRDLMALGASEFARANNFARNRWRYSFNRALPEVFAWEEMSKSKSKAPCLRDVWMSGIQVMAARERAGSNLGLYMAAKGGHNSESHNHNDVGNFIVYADGRPMLIDGGVGTYTRETFGANRYKIWTMQSAYHNLPTVDGVMQSPGREFAARNVVYRPGDAVSELSLDIAGAYPEEAKIDRWQRTCRMHRGKEASVEVVDDFTLRAATTDVMLSLLSAHEPVVNGDIVIRDSDGVGIRIEYDTSRLKVETETMELKDAKLESAWGDKLYRILLRANGSVTSDVWRLRIRMLSPIG